eukprot:9481856-Pyramimonas_sp.AAC.1
MLMSQLSVPLRARPLCMGRALAPPELQRFHSPGHPHAAGGRMPYQRGRSLGKQSQPSQLERGQRPAAAHR